MGLRCLLAAPAMNRRRLRTNLALAGVLALVVGLFTALEASPAAASTCGTPGCGGVIYNGSSSYVDVTNDWCTAAGLSTIDLYAACGINTYSQNMTHAMWFVSSGTSSTSIGYYYYDVDGFQARGGCVTRAYDAGYLLAWDRRGKGDLWIKISSTAHGDRQIVISSVAC